MSFEVFQIMIFLIPGFLSSIILNLLIVRKEKDRFNIIIEGLIFSLFFYFILSLFKFDNPVFLNELKEIKFNWFPTLLLLIFSIGFAIILTILINNDLILKFARGFLKITKKDSFISIWYKHLYQHKKDRLMEL